MVGRGRPVGGPAVGLEEVGAGVDDFDVVGDGDGDGALAGIPEPDEGEGEVEAFTVVDVDDGDAGKVSAGRVDVAGDGEIEQHQRVGRIASCGDRVPHQLSVQQRLTGTGGAHDDVARAERVRESVLAEGVTSGRAPAADGESPATVPAGSPEAPRSERPHLAKWFGARTVDASLSACIVPFGLVEPGSELADATLDAVAADLDVEGGVYRFRADVFYGGGRWPLLACFLGWNRAAQGEHAAALRHLRWAAAQADARGELPEQVDGHLLAADHRQEWLDRWGTVAQPLLWSHGMYLVLADELGLLPQER